MAHPFSAVLAPFLGLSLRGTERDTVLPRRVDPTSEEPGEEPRLREHEGRVRLHVDEEVD